MSITFFSPNSPSEKIQVSCCCSEFDHIESDCEMCHGTGLMEETIYEVPKLNLSNTNAITLLQLIGLYKDENDYCGRIEHKDISRVRQNILLVINSNSTINSAVRPQSVTKPTMVNEIDGITHISRGCTFIDCGINQEYVIDKLDRLGKLLAVAQKLNLDVCWS